MKIRSLQWAFLPSSIHTVLLLPQTLLYWAVLSSGSSYPLYLRYTFFLSSLIAVILYSEFLVFLCRSLLFISYHFCVLNCLLFRRVGSCKKILLCIMSVSLRYQRCLMRM